MPQIPLVDLETGPLETSQVPKTAALWFKPGESFPIRLGNSRGHPWSQKCSLTEGGSIEMGYSWEPHSIAILKEDRTGKIGNSPWVRTIIGV